MERVEGLLQRSDQKQSDTWDLNPLYSSIDDWKKHADQQRINIDVIVNHKGKLQEGISTVKACLDQFFSQQEELETLYTFAHLLLDQDTTNSKHKELFETAISLWSAFSSNASFIPPELISLSPDLQKELVSHTDLSPYVRYLSEVFREQDYILSQKEEQLMSLASEPLSGARDIFGQLNNADLTFENVTTDEGSTPLTHGSFITFLQNKDRKVRKESYEKYYASFDAHKYTLSAALINNLKKDTFITRARGFATSRARSLFSDNIPEAVYDTLIESIGSELAPLHAYYDMRKKHFSLEEQHIYDTYVPLVSESKKAFAYDEAVQTICDALSPLGDEYVSILKNGLTSERWVDRYENIGKRSGAYSSGCYRSMPYILMNFEDSGIESLYTLAHEAGHSMHSYFSRKEQAYPTHSYTIFVAEVASTLNEMLLTEHLRKKFKDDAPGLLYVENHLLDGIKSTVYRQTMFAEFEKETHALSDASQPVTLDTLREIHGKLQTKYFGSSLSFTEVDSLECLRIPHFYSSFYVYKYATGMAAAASLASDILAQKSGALEKYLNFLGKGSSDYSLNLLRDAGVDLESKDPVKKVTGLFASTLETVKGLL